MSESSTAPDEEAVLFYGSINWIQRHKVEEETAAPDEELDGILDELNDIEEIVERTEMPIGVGTEKQLLLWASRMRNDDEIFAIDANLVAVWIDVLPTMGGRIPWEKDDLPVRILLVEGHIPEDVLEDYENVQVTRVQVPLVH